MPDEKSFDKDKNSFNHRFPGESAELQPEMAGIGPFIPQHDTPFAMQPSGTAGRTLKLLSLIRLLLPKVLLPATTALGTIDPQGREKGLLVGANVLMTNLSPLAVRKKYALYDNKICMKEDAAQTLDRLNKQVEATDYRIVRDRGGLSGGVRRADTG